MAPMGVYLFLSAMFLFMGAAGALGFCFPQLAERFENIFQFREVELTGWGLFVHKSGGPILIVSALLMPVVFGFPVLVIPGAIGTAIPPLYFYHTRGVFIVQGLFDPTITPRIEERQERNRPPQ